MLKHQTIMKWKKGVEHLEIIVIDTERPSRYISVGTIITLREFRDKQIERTIDRCYDIHSSVRWRGRRFK